MLVLNVIKTSINRLGDIVMQRSGRLTPVGLSMRFFDRSLCHVRISSDYLILPHCFIESNEVQSLRAINRNLFPTPKVISPPLAAPCTLFDRQIHDLYAKQSLLFDCGRRGNCPKVFFNKGSPSDQWPEP